MARKTNKTAHVLNLIAKSKDEHQALEEGSQSERTGGDASGDLLFMDMEYSNEKSISEQIAENLEELSEMEEGTMQNESPDGNSQTEAVAQAAPTEAAAQAAPTETAAQAAAAETAATAAAAAKAADEAVKAADEAAAKAAAAAEAEAAEAAIAEAVAAQAAADTIDSMPPVAVQPAEAPAEAQYQYVNVYENLVRDRVEEFQKMFDVCTCPRCTTDIIALALTNLPAKYVVTEVSKVSPLLSYYSAKFKTAVAAQLSNACIVIKQNPFH